MTEESANPGEDEQLRLQVEVWKEVVAVQRHFNDIEMKIRNYALTLFLAVLAATAVAVRDGHDGLAVWILIAGLLAWCAFYFMDVGWYHRLLVGAVNKGRELESKLVSRVPGIDLATAIGEASPIPLIGKKMHSRHKVHIFYCTGILILLGAVLGILVV